MTSLRLTIRCDHNDRMRYNYIIWHVNLDFSTKRQHLMLLATCNHAVQTLKTCNHLTFAAM